MKLHKLFVLLISLISLPDLVSSEESIFEIELRKYVWIPGEPMLARIQANGTETVRSAKIYLDNVHCDDKTGPIADSTPPPPLGGTIGQDSKLELPHVLEMEVNISRWCNLEVSSANLFGKHTVCYGVIESQQLSCGEFEIVKPSGTDLLVFEKFPSSLRDVISDGKSKLQTEILQNYPTSTYAAHILWFQGHAWYEQMKEIGAEKDFKFDEIQKKAYERSPKALDSARENLRKVIRPWGQLYRNFPDFIYRDELLYGLSRAYFQIGAPEKSVPFLKELKQKYPNGRQAKKAEGHMQLLKSQSIWKD
jgi:hypothetical protein